MVTDRDMWAEAHFGKAKLGDKRRTQRLVRLARQFAAVPGGTITGVKNTCQPPMPRNWRYRALTSRAIRSTSFPRYFRASSWGVDRRASIPSLVPPTVT